MSYDKTPEEAREDCKKKKAKEEEEYIDSTVQAYKDELETREGTRDLMIGRGEKTQEINRIQDNIDLLKKAIKTRMERGEYEQAKKVVWKDWSF